MRESNRSRGGFRFRTAVATTVVLGCACWPTLAQAQEQTYTLNADFDQGVLNNVNHNAPNGDQLQLDRQSFPEPFLWVAQTNEGIILKIDTRTGRQIGRYPSTRATDCPSCPAPDGKGRSSSWYPSRTAVDLNGDVWVANRSFSVQGSITKIGSTPSSCVDRNGNGTIETSNDANGDGLINMDDPAEYKGQADECLIKSIPVGPPDAVLRAIALDQDGKIWVGAYNQQLAYKVDPVTGAVLTTINLGTTPYGFVVKDNYLYSAALGQPVARANLAASPITVQRMNCPNNYGITVNRAGVAWFGSYGGGILKADFDNPANGCPTNGLCSASCQSFGGDTHYGVTVDGDDQIWAASPDAGRVQKYSPTGTLLGAANTGGSPYGVAIGHDGKIWTAAFYNVSSIVSGAVGGPPGATASYSTDYPNHSGLYNYTYSDFTGFQLRNVTVQQGTWTVVKDGGRAGVPWGTLRWNQEPAGTTPEGTEITGEVRAAESVADLALQPFLAVTNNTPFTLTGRYIEIRMTLRNTDTRVNQTPVLSDVTIKPAPQIDAVNDTGARIVGASGGTSLANVLLNDSLNGAPAPINPNDVILTMVSSTSTKVRLVNQSVVVDPNLAEGNYSLRYRICQVGVPTNCDEAEVAVPVDHAPIAATADMGESVNGASGGTSVPNVLVNDSYNGSTPVDPNNVTITKVGSDSTKVKLVNRAVTVDPNTPAGTYHLTYRICEKLNPSNCSDAVVTVPVSAPTLLANADDGLTVIGALGGIGFPDVLWNDTLDGVVVQPAQVSLPAFVGSTSPNIVLSGVNVVILPGTPAGIYQLTYRICQTLNPSLCSNATVTVPVIGSQLVAVDDAGDPINGSNGGTSVESVLDNDTVNGVSADPNLVTTSQVSSTSTGVSLVNNSVVVASGTPQGNYVLVYRLCEKLNPTNCKNANVTVPVTAAPIQAVNDNGVSINGFVGGVGFTNVLANDKLNGAAVVPAKVTISFVSSSVPGLTLSGTNVLVAAQTPAGDQTLLYRICENLNPTNCSTATVTIPVTAAVIKAVNDTGVAVGTVAGGTSVADVLANDTLNGVKLDPSKVNLTTVSSTNPRVTLSGSKVVVAAGTADGSYTLTYQICEKLNPTNCSTAVATVKVNPVGACTANTFTTTGNDPLSGLAGNIKTFTIGGINVKVSAWARSKILGTYYPAYLGAYSGGLGVTDLTEGSAANNTHAADNNGTEDNFLVYEFDRRIVPKQAVIGFVYTDSDITVWYGDAPGGVNPYVVHQSLNASILSALTSQNNDGGNGNRTASFNTGLKAGNMMVVSARVNTFEWNDYVKIQKLVFGCK